MKEERVWKRILGEVTEFWLAQDILCENVLKVRIYTTKERAEDLVRTYLFSEDKDRTIEGFLEFVSKNGIDYEIIKTVKRSELEDNNAS